ncbi:two-component system sporulation sensor kinase B [Anoxybacillus mongoliensis]|uniref:histidine kinase n=1 Tax=Anoxybacillus mongoliensis TaxID=452565 RepID=A0A7W8N725_9BACL|nr:ATP-binding protein [Anoxybacillus mongoliensis]MBB5356159.1 two-component system sporulation sensor kinase B [Anoxybacillus mongoliensis]MCX8003146.1 ATP-binding protein [Anoxybacillus mongoliensis]
MPSLIKEILLNLFFIILALLIVPIWLEERRISDHLKTILKTIAIGVCIIFCMTFPIHTTGGLIFDLRQVAIWIGGLYGGAFSAIFLSIVTVIYRIIIGGTEGIIITMIITAIQVIICFFFYQKFQTYLSVKNRIVTIILLSVGTTILTIVLSRIWIVDEYQLSHIISTYFPAQPLAAFLGAYITETIRKHSELRRRIIRAEKMEVVGHLAASISHEVRNPLTVSRGFMQLLLQSERMNYKDKQYIQIAIEEIDRAEAIITDYLTFAKPAPEHVEKLNVKTEIERVIDILRPLANMNSIEIQTSLLPFAVKGERQKFQQCLLNVMKNAIEAMPSGGTLRINVSIDKDYVLIHIGDTGVGMTKEQIERLGEPYFTTKGAKGTGLGMMVVYRIVETMKGDLFIHSEVGEGTDVYMYFPSYYKSDIEKSSGRPQFEQVSY